MIYITFISKALIKATELIPPCILYTYFGIYCPGCGGTRSLIYLLHGDIIRSFIAYPAIPVTMFIICECILRYILSVVTSGRIKKLYFKLEYVYMIMTVILINWIIRNILLLKMGIKIIGQ